MNPIAVTVTGRLGDDSRQFTTRDGTPGVELRLAVDLPSRVPGGDGPTRGGDRAQPDHAGQLAPDTAARSQKPRMARSRERTTRSR
jgi:hypothetical protein